MNQPLAMVFPGQGSQSVGMLADIAQVFPEIQETFSEASDALCYDLWKIVQQGPAETLDQTVYTQPALLAASYAIWRILKKHHHYQPVQLAGHSLGEYTALVCADAISFATAIKLVAARGDFMQAAVLPGVGAMAAIIGLDEAAVVALCKAACENSPAVLTPANFNSIGQIVIAGHKNAVEKAVIMAKEKGAKLAVLLPVSVPSHCQLMQPAAERLADWLATTEFKIPSIPVVNNVDVKPYDSADAIREGLKRQLYSPVRWTETIQYFAQQGITHIIECGPGKILTGLNKRIDKNLQLSSTADIASIKTLLAVENEDV